ATDRGRKPDFDGLTFGNMRIALFHLDKGTIELLGHMDQGKNIDPAWAPDGRSLAFVSDRSGISNVFLYDLGDGNIFQLTDVYTGVSGITPLSPCLSWAHEADRLAFAYYEEGEYNVYAVDNPRSLRRQPYQPPATMPVTSLLAAQQHEAGQAAKPAGEAAAPAPAEEQRGGGTAISLSDILGNHTMVFSGSVNGRLSEAQVLAAYINQAHRLNWAFGGSQQPLYFYLPTTVTPNTDGTTTFTPQIERFVIRDLFAQAFYPFNRFTRVELGGHFSNISQSVLQEHFLCDPSFCQFQDEAILDLGSVTYYGPQVALVHDNSLFGFVGPFAGARSRFELSPSFGDWRFTAGLADWRRYLFFRPFTLAVRGLFFGRFGRDAELFPQYL